MAGKFDKSKLIPRSIRTGSTTTTFFSPTEMVAWEKFCAEQEAAKNPKAAIRSFAYPKRRRCCKRRKCC